MTKYLFAAWTSFRTRTAYRAEIVMSVLTTLFTLAVQVFLWQSLYSTSPTALGVSADAMITYFIISSTIGLVLRNSDMTWQMAEDVKQGVIATFICRPVSYPIHTLFRSLGSAVFSFAFMAIPLAVAGALLFRLQPPASPAAALLAILLSLGAFLVYFLIWFITGTMSFWVNELHWSVPGFINAFMWFFSGSLIPLWIFPDWLRGIALILPARFAYDLPLSVYIGRMSPGEGIIGLGMEAAWLAALCGAAFLFWRAGTRKLAIQGG